MSGKAAIVFALISAAMLPAPAEAQAPPAGEPTWFDRDGHPRTREELDAILRAHELWVSNQGGSRADLSGASLSDVDLTKVILNGANLSGTDLSRTDLSGAGLFQADLNGADMYETNLSGARLYEANLSGARLMDANMGGARVFGANLQGVVFEPASNPLTESTAGSVNLEFATYEGNSGPLTEVRTALKDRGFREAERRVTYALKRREADILWERCQSDIPAIGRANSCGFYLLNRLAFDLPAQYGMTPGRPLLIAAAMWLVFSALYVVFIHVPGSSGLYVVVKRALKGKELERRRQIDPRIRQARPGWRRVFDWLSGEWRVVRAAMMFSLMSAFNIGFREIDFGRWIRLLMKREYDIKPVGWARTVSGVQSLVSVYLVALWVLTYFGRPFE